MTMTEDEYQPVYVLRSCGSITYYNDFLGCDIDYDDWVEGVIGLKKWEEWVLAEIEYYRKKIRRIVYRMSCMVLFFLFPYFYYAQFPFFITPIKFYEFKEI